MPTIQKVFTLEVSPAKFVESCTRAELYEVLLLASGRLQRLEAGDVYEVAAEPAALPPAEPKASAGAPPEESAPKAGAGRRLGAPVFKWTADNVALLRAMRPAEAAKRLGLSPAAIHSARRRFGVAKPQKNPEKAGESSAPAAGGRGELETRPYD
jgi:hypothetical protein